LLHALGELCLSPVGLSSVTKLAPPRLAGQMLGIWFLATSLGNLLAGVLAGNFRSDAVAAMPVTFLVFAVVGIGAAILLALLARPVQRLVGGPE